MHGNMKLYHLNDWNKIKSHGWQAIYDKDLVALKSPYNLHRCNLCWNVHSETMLQKIITFYQDIPFFLYNTHDINSNYLQLEGNILAMKFEMHNLKQIECYNIMIIVTQNIHLWSKVLASAIDREHKAIFLFVKTLSKLQNYRFLLLYWQNIPVATSMLSIYDNSAIMSFVSVRKQFRTQGFGKIIILKTISLAHDIGIKTIYLYSADRISHIYKKIGFTLIDTLYLYRSVSIL